MSELNKYRKLTDREHARLRSGVYIGSKYNTTRDSWLVEDDSLVYHHEVSYNPGIIKLFDETISNSVDEHTRSGNVSNIWVNIYPMTGEISIKDDGGIPVKLHPEHGQYIPEMIFTELRAGSNFDDDDRTTAGTNGMGASLVAILSNSFTINTCDGTKRFVQTYTDGLEHRTDPIITNSTDNGTEIRFIPDYEFFDCQLDDGNISKMIRRVYDLAACTPGVQFHLNDKKLKMNSFKSFLDMFHTDYVHENDGNWDVAVMASPDSSFSQISFVNGIDTYEGGTHVDYIVNQITSEIRGHIKKKHKIDVKPNVIKQQMMLVMKCVINAPGFSSQTKEYMNSEVRNFGTTYEPSQRFIKKILDSDVVQKVLDWVEGEKRRIELQEIRKANKQSKNKSLKGITKFDDATGKDRSKCSLILTEGDSAANAVVSARDSSTIGVYALKGKIMNVRGVSLVQILANEEIKNIIDIIGLKIGHKVTNLSELRFSKLVIGSDQDFDGYHIRGLIFNFINEFWPELFELGFVHILNTPIIVARIGKKEYEFTNVSSYDEWAKNNPKHTSKYNKGLGGFITKDFKRFLSDDAYIKRICLSDTKDDLKLLDMVFSKSSEAADIRKQWLDGAQYAV